MKEFSIPDCSLCDEASCATGFLTKAQLGKLSKACQEGCIPKREMISMQGSQTSQILYLRSGIVKEFQGCKTGHSCIVQLIKPFSYIGLPSFFAGQVNQYSYEALDECRVCYIDAALFRQLILENGAFANSILESMSRDSMNSHHRFLNLRQKQTYGKLADALLYFSEIIYESFEFELGVSRQEIASLIGVSRESATRAMHYLKEEGVIGLNGRKIFIIDQERLQLLSRTG